MTTWLKQSTATDVEIGAFVDDTDGKTPETGLSIALADCQLIKNGGAAAQKNDTSSATHRGGGHYTVPLNTTDTGTLGRLRLYINKTGALPQWRDFMVVPANVYDAVVAGSDKLQVHTDEITNGLITAATIATDAIDNDAIAASAVTELQSGLATASALATVNAYVDELETRLTATRAGYLDNLSGGAVATASALATVNAYVDELESRLTAARAGYLDNLSGGAVALASTLAAVLAYVDELEARLTATRAGYLDNLSGGAVATAASIAALNDLSAADVNAEVVDALSADTYAEPGSVPAATSSLASKIGWLFMMARNKRVTSATQDKVRNDADSADIGTAGLSDDGTAFTRGEYS